MKNIILCLTLVIILLLSGCSSTSQKTVGEYKKFVKTKNYTEALKLARSDKFYPKERSRLLKLIEVGMVHYLAGEFLQANELFATARDLSDKLYTVSISKKALSMVSNDNVDNYYGERYERSMIRFYLAISSYMLYQKGVEEAYTKKVKVGKDKFSDKKFPEKKLSMNERRNRLFAARATITEWDTLLSSYKADKKGKSVYKDDLTAKIFGAYIHEQIGGRGEIQIAINLYKDAKKLLFRNYNTYPVFNHKSESFRKDFKKLPSLGESKVLKKYVSSTGHYKRLIKFLDNKIANLKKRKGSGNVTVIIENSFVSPKIAKKVHFPLNLGGALVAGGGIVSFTINVLGLAYGTRPAISFELPQVKFQKTKYKMSLIAKSSSGKSTEVPLVIMDPISDIAVEALENDIGAVKTKIGARLAVKHIAAIAAAYSIYKASRKSMGELGAHFTASASYAAANKGIEASEQADLRFWSTLPHDLRMNSINLGKGNYDLFLKRTNKSGVSTQKKLGNISVNSKKDKQLLSYRVF